MRPRAGWARCAAVWAAALAAAGCAREEKVLYYKPFFSGLEGAQTQTPAVITHGGSTKGTKEDGTEVVDASKLSLVKDNPDGSKTLISKNGLHLMSHIQRTLADGDAGLLARQVLSSVTREEFRDRGVDPKEAYTMLKPHERDIARLFARMPLGEHSPNVEMTALGNNTFRVQVTGRSRDDLYWTGFDMALERGNWKLRWFVR